jgi:hypothetical protein
LCTISPENKPPEEETPEELSSEVESPEKKKWKYDIFGPVVHTPNGVMPCLNTCGYLYYEVQSTTYVIRFFAEI